MPKIPLKKSHLWYLYLIAVPLLTWWPLSFGIFSLKNDAVSYFLPYRYHISESIRHGHFPFWSPYLYTGLPLHADIQSGVWNPVVFLFSLGTRYSMRLLQWETLLYICIAGIGFYKLCRAHNWQRPLCFLLAVSYQCSGFFIDAASFIPWITSAAYLPFVLLYFRKILEHPNRKHSVLLGFSSSLLFLAGYLSFFIITLYLLIAIALYRTATNFRNNGFKSAVPLFKSLVLSAFICLLIVSPALLSYLEFLPYYSRGNGVSLQQAFSDPFQIQNTLSWLFPPASYRTSTGNDISARNAYFGLIPLLFILFLSRRNSTRLQLFYFLATLFFFLFSLGAATPIRSLLYHLFPLMDTFRHPSTARLFMIIGMLLLAGCGFQNFKADPSVFNSRWWTLFLLIGVSLLIAACAIAMNDQLSLLSFSGGLSVSAVKTFLDTASMSLWILLVAPVQLLFLLLVRYYRKNTGRILSLGIVNSCLMAVCCMPFTTISTYSTAAQDKFIDAAPEAFPVALAEARVENNLADQGLVSPYGYLPFYSKKISLQGYFISPTIKSSYDSLVHDSLTVASITSKPFYYATKANLQLNSFTPNGFTVAWNSDQTDTLHITQQFNSEWKAFVNGIQYPIEPDKKAFMKLAISAGKHNITVRYHPMKLLVLGAVSLLVLLAGSLYIAYIRFKK